MVEKRETKEGALAETSPLPHGYSPKQVEEGVKVLFQVIEKSAKKSLFVDEGEYIQLQISSIRIPKNKKKHYRFTLPNGYLKDTAEVCLFVKNLSKDDREYENTIRHFKNIIAEAGVKNVSEVISVNQLMQEYKTYEMKRRLAARFDMFLADSAVSNWLHGALGKGFHRCRKQPTPVNINSKNLKEEIDKALMKTTLTVTGKGAQFVAKIGHTKQSVQQICQNIEAFVIGLRYTMPGKWINVRSLLIRTEDSIAVPVYYSFAHPNSVKVPKQALPLHRKAIPSEVDEITTLPDGYEVMVLPSGDVKVKGKKSDGTIGWLSDQELRGLGDFEPLMDDDEEVEDGDADELILEAEGNEKAETGNQESEDNYSDTDEEEAVVEAAEDAYLKELTEEKRSSKQKMKESDSSKQKLERNSNKRSCENSESSAAVKKAKSITKPKLGISTDWKVEVITNANVSGTEVRKSVKNAVKSWKVDEVMQTDVARKDMSGTEARVRTEDNIVKKKKNTPSSTEAKKVHSNFGAKGKVSGNKLGTKRKLKLDLKK